MEKFVINPENYRKTYIENLNACFGNWGGEREYEWGLARQVGPHSTDIMLIENEEDGVIAGSAVSYRKLEKQDSSFDIGIMTGSWTLPAARRKGCFTKMIHCSRDLCKTNDVPYLTAFVTETNASSRRLRTEGSYMFPTAHLFSPEEPFKDQQNHHLQGIPLNKESARKVYDRTKETQKDLLSFSYSFDEFYSQYIERIKKVTILQIENDFVLLEDGQNEVKILLLTFGNKEDFRTYQKAVYNWCLSNRGRKSFFFSTRKDLTTICEELGFENVPGFFTISSSIGDDPIDEKKFEDLHINMADKM